MEAVHRVLRGQIYLSHEMMTNVVDHQFSKGTPQSPGTPVERLSDRELQVLQLIGRGKGTRQIAKLLHVSVKTVEWYRQNIKSKLKLETAAQLAHRAVQCVHSGEIS